MTRGGQAYWYHFDGLGSTRILSDETSAVTDTYDYDVFGNLAARSGTTNNSFLFTGQSYDANSGFYHLRARYYQPGTGRFTAIDPYEGDEFSPDSFHKYLYCSNDPANRIDPTGLSDLIEMTVAMSVGEALTVISVPTITAVAVLEHPMRYYRYTSKAKVLQAQSTDLVFGDLGVTWWSPDQYMSASLAKSSLSLKFPPEGWLSVTLYSTRDLLFGPTPVGPLFGEAGGGVEYWTFKPIPFWSRAPEWGLF